MDPQELRAAGKAGASPIATGDLLVANRGAREQFQTKAIVRSRAGRPGSAPSYGRRSGRRPSAAGTANAIVRSVRAFRAIRVSGGISAESRGTSGAGLSRREHVSALHQEQAPVAKARA